MKQRIDSGRDLLQDIEYEILKEDEPADQESLDYLIDITAVVAYAAVLYLLLFFLHEGIRY